MRYYLGEIVGVKRSAPAVKTMVDSYVNSTYPAFDIVGKVQSVVLGTDKYDIRLNACSYDVVRLYDHEIFKLDDQFSNRSNLFEEFITDRAGILRPYTYLNAFMDYVLSKKNPQRSGFGGFTALNSVISASEIHEAINKANERIAEEFMYSTPKYTMTKEELNAMFGVPKFEYKKIIFSGPCTIVLWADGTKTIAKANKDELFDPEKGVAVCFMKRVLGETEGKKVLRKANKDFYEEVTRVASKQLDEELKKCTFPLPEGVTMRPFNFDIEPMDNNKFVKFVDGGYKRYCVDCVHRSKENDEYPCCGCFYDNSHPAFEDKKKEKKDE